MREESKEKDATSLLDYFKCIWTPNPYNYLSKEKANIADVNTYKVLNRTKDNVKQINGSVAKLN